MEASSDVTKQDSSEKCEDVKPIKDAKFAHVNFKESPGSLHEHSQTETTQLKDLLTCSCAENSKADPVASCLTVNHCNYERKLSEACRSVFSNKNDQKSMESDFCASGTIDCKSLNNNDRYVQSRSPIVNMDLLLSSLFNISPSALSDKSSTSIINRSHPIIAQILTGEDNSLGKERADVSPEKNISHIFKGDITFSESPESPENSDSDDDDVESFIDGTICKSLMTENLALPVDWETNEHELDIPKKESETATLEHQKCLKNGKICSLLIADVSTHCNLKQVITQVLEVSSIKVVPLAEAMDICNNETFHFIWTCIVSSIQEDFISLSTAIRYSSKKNKNAILIALTDIAEGKVKLVSFDEVCHLPVSKETIRQVYQKYQWIFGENTFADIEQTVLSPESVRTPESAASLDSSKTRERSHSFSSQCESASGEFDLGEIPLMEMKNSDSKKSTISEMINTHRNKSSPVDSISPAWCRAEHANKEKQRRERIKDSCDQLRVLLPYVRGRKTDMASILEMTVDYLRIITSALPQDFQSQIISIMSNGSPHVETLEDTASRKTNSSKMYSPPVKQPRSKPTDKKSNTQMLGMSYSEPKSKIRITTKSLTKSVVSSPLDYNSYSTSGNIASHNDSQTNVFCSLKKTVQTNIMSDINSAIHISKRECPSALTESNFAKRPNLNTLTTLTEVNQPKSISFPTSKGVSITKDVKKEKHFDLVPQAPNFQAFKLQPKLKDNEIASKQFLTAGHMNSDLFQFQQQTQVNTLTSRMETVERDIAQYGGMYFDGNYYTYFPSVNDISSGGFCISGPTSDYVNPNAVLPMTSYCPRTSTFHAAHSIDQTKLIEAGQLKVTQRNDLVNSSTLKTNHI